MLAVGLAVTSSADVRLPAIFSDNMVLQRMHATPVYGWAEVGERITVQVGSKIAETVTGSNGRWRVEIDTSDICGPVGMAVTGRRRIEINNAMVGEVWLGAGQSNMEMPVLAALNAQEEIPAAGSSDIRLFAIKRCASDQLIDELTGTWEVCRPETAARFSAVGYYFARDLQRALRVPVGVVVASWGGTAAQAWTPASAIAANPELRPWVTRYESQLAGYAAAQAKYLAALQAWQEKPGAEDSGESESAATWRESDFDDSAWPEVFPPGFWNETGSKTVGATWYRRHFELTGAAAEGCAILSLGALGNGVIVYLNGRKIADASPTFPPKLLEVSVPARLLRGGQNTLAIRVFNSRANNGLLGLPVDLFLANPEKTDKLAILDGRWRARLETAVRETVAPVTPPVGPNDSRGVGTLYNGMIHPLHPFAIRGVLWYQGESNRSYAEQYRKLLPLMIEEWRRAWRQDKLPFVIVQLPNYMQEKPEPSESDWAELREAQALTAQMPETGIVAAIDLGEIDSVHPRRKAEVGQRLAWWVENRIYGLGVEYSGPRCIAVSIDSRQVRLRFEHAVGLHFQDNVAPTGFAVAGVDRKFHWAEARIAGDEITLSSPAVARPIAVRYAWGDSPPAKLFNGSGLPAFPFRTDDWPGVTAGRR